MKYTLKILFIIFISSNCYGLNIDESIKSTIENNSKVKIAFEKLNEAKELLIYSKGYKLPSVTGSIVGTYKNSENSTASTTTTPETFSDSYKITISQNLYDAGFNDLEIEKSKILYNDETLNFQKTIQDLILEAINGYLTVINYEKSLEATIKNYDSVNKAFEETKTRFNLGSATLYDLQKAEASFESVKTNLFSAEENLKISKKIFKTVVGLDPTDMNDIFNIKLDNNIKHILDNAMKNNLDLLLISNDIKIKEILILKEKKSKKSNLDITGTGLYTNGSRLERGSNNTSGSVALTLTIPLFQKGQDDSNIRKYQSQKLQSEIAYLDAIDDLQILIGNVFKDFKINQSKMKSNKALIKSIQTSISSLEEEYLIGTKTINDLIEEEEKLLLANVNYLDNRKDFLMNYFTIKSLDSSLINLFQMYLPSYN